MKAFVYLLLLCNLFTSPVLAQLGMGGQPHPSAALDVKATDKAFYPPRLTSVQRNAIVNPQAGAFVFDTDKGTVYLFDGLIWSPLALIPANPILTADRTASDGAVGDGFGYSVSISGDYALVGAPSDDVGSNEDQGGAYVFFRVNGVWTQQAKLTADDGSDDDNFGWSVSISGEYALVSAPEDGNLTVEGSAYVFIRSGTIWRQQAKLIAGDNISTFGFHVSISGNYALVGAPLGQGSAYVFVRNGSAWTQQAKLIANDGGLTDIFGNSVSISGDYALVGSRNDDLGTNTKQGSAYVFVRNGTTWTQQAKLTANDGASNDNFGWSVSISGNYALVGAPSDDIGSNVNQGSAYVFVRNGTAWAQQAKLTAGNGAFEDLFGSSVSISGDYALVGAYADNVGGQPLQGSAYIFHRNNSSWPFATYITDNSPALARNGYSVGLSNGSFIIGGPGFETNKGKVAFGVVEN